jgi:hypothetical protein
MIRIATVVVGITIGALSMSAADRGSKIDSKQIELQAKNARTAADHQAVARLYEQRAAEFEAKAKRHDEQADRMANSEGYNPMKYKWPALAQAPIDSERAKAMQARRAARESLELMARHRELAATADAGTAE